MFEVNNGIANINGKQGKYDNKVTDPSVKYGRNSVENYYTYLEAPIVNDQMNTAPILDFGINPDATVNNAKKINNFLKENDDYLKALPPLEYEYRYMPTGTIDTKAVLGAAYEEMGANKELSIEEINNRFAPNENYTAEALDLNKDGKIDIAEYGSSILAADMLSKSTTPEVSNIDGTINQKGLNAVLAYAKKSNTAAAAKMYASIYNTYNLGDAQKEFKAE